MLPQIFLLLAAACSLGLGFTPAAVLAQEPPPVDPEPSAGDTIHYTVIINGHSKGERRVWRENAATWRYELGGDPYDS